MARTKTTRRCQWCGTEFPVERRPGRPQLYCRRSHRQRHYEAMTLAERHGLGPRDALVDSRTLGRLNDRLYILEAACDDVRADIAESPDLDTYRDALVHLLEAALPLQSSYLEPRAIGKPQTPG